MEQQRIRTFISLLMLMVCIGCRPLQAQSADSQTLSLMPVPQHVQLGSGRLIVDSSFTFAYTSFHDARLERAVGRMLHQLAFQTGLVFDVSPTRDTPQATLSLDVQGPGEEVQSVDEDESYVLTSDAKHVSLRAATDVGAIRGLQTFLQLLTLQEGRYSVPAVIIHDRPRFAWRGVMLDCSRHFEPVPLILRTLDAMAAVKLNVFHWHLTDDQGFRAESKKFPDLQGRGSDGLYYSQDQMRQVVAFARDRGIRVVPEFDMPGHAASWFIGYPDLASGPGPYTPVREFGLPKTAMDPTRESTYQFIDAFLGEMATIFPDTYVHIGGDESRGEQWLANPRIRTFMKDHGFDRPAALQTYFNQRLLNILDKHNKHMMGWGEILHSNITGEKQFNPLPKSAVVEPGIDSNLLALGAQSGYQMIASAPYYLNRMYPAEQYYSADPVRSDTLLRGLWPNTIEWKRYMTGQHHNMELTPEQAANILGGEVSMWGELVDSNTVEAVIWPRTAAIAERLWSPEDVRDPRDMYRRLQIESLRLEELGIAHISEPQKMLRNLAGTTNPTQLTAFASLLEPVGFAERRHEQNGNQLTPLDHFVDAVVPDPPSRRGLTGLVDQVLADPSHNSARTELAAKFRHWQEITPSLETLVSGSPRMSEVKPRVNELSELGTVGLAALDCIASGHPPSTMWGQNAIRLLNTAEQPSGMVDFTFLAPMRRLVLACDSTHRSKGP